MTKEIIIVLLLITLFYYYRQSQTQPAFLDGGDSGGELDQVKSANQTLVSFLRNQLNSNSLEELKTKLGEKTLDELIEENEDYETEIDTLTRTKNSLEQDLTAQSEAFQARLREKDREVKKFKEELTSSRSNLDKLRKDLTSEKSRADETQKQLNSEKQQHKGSIERISLLSKQVKDLEKDLKDYKEADQE
jgi:DNA repair exonuclease SbcCD ATPase subunit